jgi:putative transposase
VTVKPLLDRVGRGADLIGIEAGPMALVRLRAAQPSGRPFGADDFISLVERRLGRPLRPRQPAPKPRTIAQVGNWTWELRKWACSRNPRPEFAQ